jgi:hypothetical protein
MRKGRFNNLPKMYFYRNQIIRQTPSGKGWFWEDDLEVEIYKTIHDAMNAIDKWDNNTCNSKTGIIPKRLDKPIKIIGKMMFVLDDVDDQGEVKSHYEYQWF